MQLSFFGVRGSCPCAGPGYERVGGNISRVLVSADGEPPLVLDLGTGLRALGESLSANELALDAVGAGERVGRGGPLELGRLTIRAGRVPHPGNTLGYRIEAGGRTVAYLPDHQASEDRSTVPDAVRALCDGADVLVHDAQYTDEELDAKPDWGHSTVGYAVRVAAQCGVRRLFLFHHDPSHTDWDVAAMARGTSRLPDARRLEEVTVAEEGTTVCV